jgi:hypothetical protein
MRITIGLSAAVWLAAAVGWAGDESALSFSGKGNGPVEVRDKSGEVTEVISQRNLTLNTIPADAAAREQAYREEQAVRMRQVVTEREAAKAEEAARQAEAAKAAEETTAQAAAAAKQKEEEEFDPTPRKVRRNTVRGTRYVATEPVDPSLRTPENTGVRQVWPPDRQKLP